MTELIELDNIRDLPKNERYLSAAVKTTQEAQEWAKKHNAKKVYTKKHTGNYYAAYIPIYRTEAA